MRKASQQVQKQTQTFLNSSITDPATDGLFKGTLHADSMSDPMLTGLNIDEPISEELKLFMVAEALIQDNKFPDHTERTAYDQCVDGIRSGHLLTRRQFEDAIALLQYRAGEHLESQFGHRQEAARATVLEDHTRDMQAIGIFNLLVDRQTAVGRSLGKPALSESEALQQMPPVIPQETARKWLKLADVIRAKEEVDRQQSRQEREELRDAIKQELETSHASIAAGDFKDAVAAVSSLSADDAQKRQLFLYAVRSLKKVAAIHGFDLDRKMEKPNGG